MAEKATLPEWNQYNEPFLDHEAFDEGVIRCPNCGF